MGSELAQTDVGDTVTGEGEQKETGRFKLSNLFGGSTGPLLGLIALCIVLSFATDSFLSLRNFLNILDQITVLGIIAVGMTFVILIGGIDLSVGSVLALSMMVLGYLNIVAGMPMGIAIIGALAASAVVGIVAGILITEFKVPAFVATLAMMSIARGLANMITDGSQLIGFPPMVQPVSDNSTWRISDNHCRNNAGGICRCDPLSNDIAPVEGRFMQLVATLRLRDWPALMSSAQQCLFTCFAPCWPDLPASPLRQGLTRFNPASV